MGAPAILAWLVAAHATAAPGPSPGHDDQESLALLAGWTLARQDEVELVRATDCDACVPDELDVDEPPRWEFSGSLFYSDPPGSEDRLTPVLTADRGALHLEARYNYEDLETASLFAGGTLAREGAVELALTPLIGVAFGETTGIVPALELDLAWRRLSWYVEAEYLFDLEDHDDDFVYTWSTLTWSFTDWLSAGLAVERSRLVDTGLSVQRGLALELSAGRVGASLYTFNFTSDDFYAVVALSLAL